MDVKMENKKGREMHDRDRPAVAANIIHQKVRRNRG
jgi:hypothetical protein